MGDHGTEFPGGETTAGEQFSAGKDRAAHPCAISQADEIGVFSARAESGFTDGGSVDIVFHGGGHLEFLFHDIFQRGIGVAGDVCVGIEDAASTGSTCPAVLIPMR